MSFEKTKEALYLDLVAYILACFAIAYLLARHSLLVNKKLKPDEFECGDCTKACFGAVSRPVLSLTRVSTNELDPRGSTPSIHLKVIGWATFGCLFFYWGYCFESVVCYMSKSILGILPFRWCVNAVPLAGVLYQSAKCCLYLVFVGRLHQGFEGSSYARSNRTTRGLYAIICAFSLVMDVCWVAFARGESVDTDEKGANYCITKVPGAMLAAVVIFDWVFTATVVYLFVSALNKMLHDYGSHLDDRTRAEDIKENMSLYLLPLKYAVLSTVAVLSTMLSVVVFSISQAAFVLPIDNVLNCTVLVFMTMYWEPTYDWVCSPLLRCLLKASFLPCAALAQPQLVEMMSPKEELRLGRLGSVTDKTETVSTDGLDTVSTDGLDTVSVS